MTLSVVLTLAMLVVVKLGVTSVAPISAMSAIKHSFALIVFTMLSVSIFSRLLRNQNRSGSLGISGYLGMPLCRPRRLGTDRVCVFQPSR